MIDNRAIMGYAIVGSILIGLYILFLVVRRFLRSRMISNDAFEQDGGGVFSLPELQKMLDKGLITREEFDKLRKTLIESATKSVSGKGK